MSCNYISATLWALNSVKCFKKILTNIYYNCLDTIRSRGQLPVPSLIYYISRAMFHLDNETSCDEFFTELTATVLTSMANFMTYKHIRIMDFLLELVSSIHCESRYLRYIGKNADDETPTDQIVKSNKLYASLVDNQ